MANVNQRSIPSAGTRRGPLQDGVLAGDIGAWKRGQRKRTKPNNRNQSRTTLVPEPGYGDSAAKDMYGAGIRWEGRNDDLQDQGYCDSVVRKM